MKRTRQSERLSKKARQEEEKEVEKEEEEGIQVGVDKEEIETKESEEIENQGILLFFQNETNFEFHIKFFNLIRRRRKEDATSTIDCTY